MSSHPDWDVETSDDHPGEVLVWALSNYGDEPAYLSRGEAIEMANALLEAADVRVPYEHTNSLPEDASAAMRAVAERNDEERFKRMLDRSSFGTFGAKAAMATVSQEQADKVLARAEELRRNADNG